MARLLLRSPAAPRPLRNVLAGASGFLALALLSPAAPAGAAPVFASELVSANNAIAFRGGNVLGAPDRAGLFLLAASIPPEAPGGSLVLRFALGATNGDGLPDLIVFDEHRFELEEDEEAAIEVSSDGVAFTPLGSVFGGSLGGGVDFPAGMTEPVFFVRITQLSGSGLDVDAVQASFPVPEPGSLGLVAAGLALLARRRRSRPARGAREASSGPQARCAGAQRAAGERSPG